MNYANPSTPLKNLQIDLASLNKNFIIFIINNDLEFIYINELCQNFLSMKSEELLNTNINNVFIINYLDGNKEKDITRDKLDKISKENLEVILSLKNKQNEISFIKGIFKENSNDQNFFIGVEITEVDIIKFNFRYILFDILKISFENEDLKSFLDQTIKKIIEIPWLSFESKGGFMINYDGELRLISHYNVSDSLVKMCSKVAYGQCLCGKAAESREIIFKSHVDNDHENRPEGIKPHGHYNIPIIYSDQLLGVLFLYVKDGHEKKELEMSFLKELAQIIGLVILKYQYQYEYQHSILKLIRTNELMIQNLKKIQKLETFINTYVPNTIKEQTLYKNNHSKINFYIQENFYLLINVNGLIKFSEIFPIQKVYETLQEYYAPVIDTILKFNGDLEQYLEDRIFAIFKDVDDILQCALQVKEIFKKQNEKRKQYFFKPFHFQIAINYGKTFFGIIGSENKKNWMRYGNSLRWLSDIQKKCEKDHILVSEHIYKLRHNKYQFSSPMKLVKDKKDDENIIVRYLIS